MIFKNMTLILPTFNEENRIERVLKYYKDKGKIIVIDNYSTDNTLEVVNKYNIDIYQYKNNGTIQTEEWFEFVLKLIKTEYFVLLSISEFIPYDLLEKYNEITETLQYGMVITEVESFTCGEKIPLWGGRGVVKERRIERFFNKNELCLNKIRIHAPFEINDNKRILAISGHDNLKIIHLRDSDNYSLIKKHLDYSKVESIQITKDGRKFSILKLIKLIIKEILRYFYISSKQRHGITRREIWARIAMHIFIYIQVWEIKSGKTLTYSRDKNKELWEKLSKNKS